MRRWSVREGRTRRSPQTARGARGVAAALRGFFAAARIGGQLDLAATSTPASDPSAASGRSTHGGRYTPSRLEGAGRGDFPRPHQPRTHRPTTRPTRAPSHAPELLPRTDFRRRPRTGAVVRLTHSDVRQNLRDHRRITHERQHGPPTAAGHRNTSYPYTRSNSSAHSVRGRRARFTPPPRATERDTHRAADSSPSSVRSTAGTTALLQPAAGAKIP